MMLSNLKQEIRRRHKARGFEYASACTGEAREASRNEGIDPAIGRPLRLSLSLAQKSPVKPGVGFE